MANDLFNLDSNQTMSVFDAKKRNTDGLYRPDVDDGDKETGYVASIRFLPNFTRKEVVEQNALEKHTHYVKLEELPELNGTYDCQKVFGDTNPLYDSFWKLKNSRSVTDQEKAKIISRQTKYYSYVLIVEDKQHPELEGKILIFQYGFKIADKIKEEKAGTYGEACNVFDLAEGKDFKLVVKKIGGYNNYDSSRFLTAGPITFVKEGQKKTMPVEESNGKKVIAAAVRDKVKDILLKRDHDLEEFAPKKWSVEDRSKVNRIVSHLLGTNSEFASANSRVADQSSPVTSKQATNTSFDTTATSATTKQIDNFFDDL
jgi:hypothetical protein